MDIFFDVDYTILAVDGSLRPGTDETFRRLSSDGHRVFVWSGIGLRTDEVRRHGLEPYVADVFQKPLSDFEARLDSFGVSHRPDFVVDDYPEIVGVFGGVVVRPYYFPVDGDDEMLRVYRIATEYAELGYSQDSAFRPANRGLGRAEQ